MGHGQAASPNGEFTQVSFVNGMAMYRGGTHVNTVTDTVAKHVVGVIKRKHKDLTVTNANVKSQLAVFINCQIDRPSFDSQSKEVTPAAVAPRPRPRPAPTVVAHQHGTAGAGHGPEGLWIEPNALCHLPVVGGRFLWHSRGRGAPHPAQQLLRFEMQAWNGRPLRFGRLRHGRWAQVANAVTRQQTELQRGSARRLASGSAAARRARLAIPKLEDANAAGGKRYGYRPDGA